MKMGRTLLLVAAVLIVMLVVVVVVGGGGGEAAEEELVAQYVIIVQNIDRGDQITEGMLLLIDRPDQLSDTDVEDLNFFTSIEEVVGTEPGEIVYYAIRQIARGETLTPSMVINNAALIPTADTTNAMLIPEAWVAVSIPINRFSSVSYGLQQGDRVNVIASLMFIDLDREFQTRLPNAVNAVLEPGYLTEPYSGTSYFANPPDPTSPMGRAEVDERLNLPFYAIPSEEFSRPRLVSQTIMQGVYVLYMGDFQDYSDPVPEGESGSRPGPTDTLTAAANGPVSVTLIVSPQDAVSLNYLMLTGAQLSLALRPPGDDTNIPTDSVTLDYLLARYNIDIPIPLDYGTEPRADLLYLLLPSLLDSGVGGP